MRLIPVQYLRVGDAIDHGGDAYLIVKSLEQLPPSHAIRWWSVEYEDITLEYEADTMMQVVGHDLEFWEESPCLLQEEWNLEQKRYVDEHAYYGQAN